MLVMRRSGATSASRARARYTWSTISPAVRLRVRPSLAVAQNWQSTAQPTCDEMHCVVLSPSGMSTLSIDLPSPVTMRSLRVPSREVCTSATSSVPMRARAARRSRTAGPRSVICSNRVTPWAWTQRQACSPRKRGSPAPTASASASASVSARRSTRSSAAGAAASVWLGASGSVTAADGYHGPAALPIAVWGPTGHGGGGFHRPTQSTVMPPGNTSVVPTARPGKSACEDGQRLRRTSPASAQRGAP